MSVRLGEYQLTLPQSACFQPGWNVQSCDLSKELVVADGPGVVDRLGHLFLLTVQWVYRSAPTVLLAPAPPAEVLDQSPCSLTSSPGDTRNGYWRSNFSTARKSIDQGSAERHHCCHAGGAS